MAKFNERRNFLKGSVALGASLGVQSIAYAKDHHGYKSEEYYEWRAYKTVSADKKKAVSHYLDKALIPALSRMGIDRIGVFTHKHDPNDHTLYMLIPYKSLDDFAGVNPALAADIKYQADAEVHFSAPGKQPAFTRIESKLHKAFAGMPVLQIPPQSAKKETRILELRVYQGHTEQISALKIEQFNEGEIFVMKDVGLNPVFYGELLIGHDGPNMMYMTSASSEEASQACWAKFKVHPEWARLRSIEKYKGTVSSKTKDILVPTQYSQI